MEELLLWFLLLAELLIDGHREDINIIFGRNALPISFAPDQICTLTVHDRRYIHHIHDSTFFNF